MFVTHGIWKNWRKIKPQFFKKCKEIQHNVPQDDFCKDLHPGWWNMTLINIVNKWSPDSVLRFLSPFFGVEKQSNGYVLTLMLIAWRWWEIVGTFPHQIEPLPSSPPCPSNTRLSTFSKVIHAVEPDWQALPHASRLSGATNVPSTYHWGKRFMLFN